MSRFKIGEKVTVTSDNECYDSFRDKTLVIIHMAHSVNEHPGYDIGVGGALMDFETEDGESVPCSLYEWEIEYA